jgi:hypothetical protein
MPGSCHGILSGEQTAIESVQKAVAIGAKTAVAISHQGCAKYKDIILGMSPEEEEDFQRGQLSENEAVLKRMGLENVYSVYTRLINNNQRMQFVAVRQ